MTLNSHLSSRVYRVIPLPDSRGLERSDYPGRV